MSILSELGKYLIGLTASFGVLFGIVFAINYTLHAPNDAAKAVLACVVLQCVY